MHDLRKISGNALNFHSGVQPWVCQTSVVALVLKSEISSLKSPLPVALFLKSGIGNLKSRHGACRGLGGATVA
jgi:hypothetical protein